MQFSNLSINLNDDKAGCFGALHAEKKVVLEVLRIIMQTSRRDGLELGDVCPTLQMILSQQLL